MLQNFVPNNRPMTFSSACHGAQRPWPLLRIRLRLVVCSAGEYATVSYFHHRRRRHRHRMCVHVPAHLALIACYLLRSTPVFLTRKDTLLTPRAQPTVNLSQSLKFPHSFHGKHTHSYTRIAALRPRLPILPSLANFHLALFLFLHKTYCKPLGQKLLVLLIIFKPSALSL